MDRQSDRQSGDPLVYPRRGRVRGPSARSSSWWGKAWVRSFEETVLEASDLVTARALAPLPELLGYATPFLAPGTVCLFPKGARVEDELTEARRSWTMEVERVASASDPAGVILRLSDIARATG